VADATLRDLAARRIVAALGDAAQRWCDADFPPRVRASAAIEARLGYTAPVVDYALDRVFFGLTRARIEAAIAAELGCVEVLDGPVARQGAPAAWARGVERAVIVASDTTIGVALVPALFALCAKCSVVVKDRSDALVAAFFATLAEEHGAFSRAATARTWTGGADAGEERLFHDADVVVAFGRDEALRSIRTRCGTETRFVPFGHRAGIGYLDRAVAASVDGALAERIARDALLYDGEGCLSLHALLVAAEGDTLARIASLVADACGRVAVELPGGKREPAHEASVAAYRNLAAFRGATGAGAVFRAADAVVAVAPRAEPPPFLPRVLPVIGVANEDDVAAYVASHRLPVQVLGVAVPEPRDVAFAARIGAVRVAALGQLQDPPLGGHHGGLPRIADFVRWIDLG